MAQTQPILSNDHANRVTSIKESVKLLAKEAAVKEAGNDPKLPKVIPLGDATNLEVGPRFLSTQCSRQTSKQTIQTVQVSVTQNKYDSSKSGQPDMLENQTPESPRCFSVMPQQQIVSTTPNAGRSQRPLSATPSRMTTARAPKSNSKPIKTARDTSIPMRPELLPDNLKTIQQISAEFMERAM